MHGVQQARHACLASLSCGSDSPSARVFAEYQSLMMQVRQHTEHKRTFMFLEQVILKYNAASTCINIKDIHEVGACPACSGTHNTQHGLPGRVQLASRRRIMLTAGIELISLLFALHAHACASESGMLAALLFMHH
jgi:hypothetical protein